ncbi:molybdopterin molybdotransferase MoeA [Dysosmobacter sp.]|uniref:molybdopterin molybdotransferase MoeA n=1 Tax=Dysosmobacter sp. TaxID=2591382 RepID=UPI002A847BD7|nr:gephyrin-like molybdotransferase Glp [Dysosmobacter sp.]MDY3282169.1 molybdopterin molybdotransferase MoeA [Dysosmobacter sp.]
MPMDHLSVEEASALLCRCVSPVRRETVPLSRALGRTAARELFAVMDQPPFDRSPLDGYALYHGDLAGACAEAPAVLPVCRPIFAGDPPGEPVPRGCAVRIMTGAPIPPSADCVVRQEDTDQGANAVRVFVSPAPHDNICDRGEDLRSGALLFPAGTVLTPAHLGVLAGQGMETVDVHVRPRIGLLSAGDELVLPGTPLAPGKIYNSNRFYLAARLEQLGMEPVISPVHSDDPELLSGAVTGLLAECDAVITTGGVSVGQKDYMPAVCRRLGAGLLFHGVAVKPGSPMLAMTLSGKPVVCLSGNPFAAAATLEAVARPMLLRLAGRQDCSLPRAAGVLTAPFRKASPGRRLVRAVIRGTRVSLPAGGQVSGVLSSWMGCNCLMDIPAGSPALPAGTEVEVILL